VWIDVSPRDFTLLPLPEALRLQLKTLNSIPSVSHQQRFFRIWPWLSTNGHTVTLRDANGIPAKQNDGVSKTWEAKSLQET
jgi:hypothetical protein